MRIFHCVVESKLPPMDKDVVWLNEGIFYYFHLGKWEPVDTSSEEYVEEIVLALQEIKQAICCLKNKLGDSGVKKILVNGVECAIGEDGSVSLTIPTKVSDLENDLEFTTPQAVAIQIAQALSGFRPTVQLKTLASQSLQGTGDIKVKTVGGQSIFGTGDIPVSGGGGGTTYTPGEGISIVDKTISVDNELLASINSKITGHELSKIRVDETLYDLLDGGTINITQGGGSGEPVYAEFKSIVFTRTNFEIGSIAYQPSGGSYNSPIPTSTVPKPDGTYTGWSDGIPSGDAKLWMSTRWFSQDPDYSSEWTVPAQATDTADLDFEYATSSTHPGTPSSPSVTPNPWHNNPQLSDNWMALRTIKNGVYGAWSVFLIRGEDGADGTSISIIGSLESLEDLQDIDTSELNIGDAWIYNGETAKGPDGKYWEAGDLIIWDGETFRDVGKFRGPKGDSGDSYKIFVAFSNDGVSLTSKNGETPGKYVGYYTGLASEGRPTIADRYKPWIPFKGEDGTGYEYIFLLTNDPTPPDVPNTGYSPSDPTIQRDDYIPSGGWIDDPPSVDSTNRYCWVVYRKKTNGIWGTFRGYNGHEDGKASLFSRYSADGAQGPQGESGVSPYYLDLSNQNASINCDINGNILSGAAKPTCKATLYLGGSKVSSGIEYSYSLSNILVDGLTFATSNSEYIFNFANNFSFQGTSLEITITARIGGQIVGISTMTVTKSYPGTNGEDATSYWLIPSTNSISVDSDGNSSESVIILTAYKQVGENTPEVVDFTEETDLFLDYCTDDAVDFIQYPEDGIEVDITESARHNYTVRLVRGTFAEEGDDDNTVLDLETIPIVRDGSIPAELSALTEVFGSKNIDAEYGALLRTFIGVTTDETSENIEAFLNGSAKIGYSNIHKKLLVAAGVSFPTDEDSTDDIIHVNAPFKVFEDGHVEASDIIIDGNGVVDVGAATDNSYNVQLNKNDGLKILSRSGQGTNWARVNTDGAFFDTVGGIGNYISINKKGRDGVNNPFIGISSPYDSIEINPDGIVKTIGFNNKERAIFSPVDANNNGVFKIVAVESFPTVRDPNTLYILVLNENS